MTTVDWTVLTEDGIEEVASNAARTVSNNLGGKRVAYLAEYEDLLQEARILLATNLVAEARSGQLSLLERKLIDDLRDLTKGARVETVNLEATGIEEDCE